MTHNALGQAFLRCQLCNDRQRIPPSVARDIAAGTIEAAGCVCGRCAETEAGRALLARWPAPTREMLEWSCQTRNASRHA